MPDMRLKFIHGLGDVAHAVLWLQLWKQRGYDITVQIEENKRKLWEVGGFNLVADGELPHHGYPYNGSFNRLDLPDWECNKAAFGMMDGTLPNIGIQSELWDDLCRVRLHVEDFDRDALDEARAFLDGMPKPIICIHGRGTNWQERKSLTPDVQFNLILRLLEETGGSVISLDWDGREPIVGHERCKGIRPSWGMIAFDRLAALYSMADLMIGIDSGPFHCASFTKVPALGVFREIHPVACCIPNPNAAYMVSHNHNEQWDTRADVWRFIKYEGTEPTADGIAEAALSVLSGVYRLDFCDDHQVAKASGRYTYRRIGYDEREMHLAMAGTISTGSAGCERRWSLRQLDGVPTITISGEGNRPTCRLVSDDNGTWRGRWIHSEQMPVELVPI